MSDNFEAICPHCRENVLVYADDCGIHRHSSYVVVADWIYHSACWDKMVEDFPPGGKDD